MTAIDQPVLVDEGPCDDCGEDQWDHVRGKKSCKDPACPCTEYKRPKRPAPAAGLVVDPSSEIPGVLVEGPDRPDLGVCVGGPEPARPGDVELPAEPSPDEDLADALEPDDPAAWAGANPSLGNPITPLAAQIARLSDEVEAARVERQRLTEQVADAIRERNDARAENDRLRGVNVELGRAALEIERLTREKRELVDERDAARRDRDAAAGEAEDARRRIEGLAGELDAARAARDTALRSGTAAAANVIGRYEAHACLECGGRYGQPYTDHGCGPLTPVVVIIARQEVPGA